ncbi:hypothetical protein [Arenimonas metalli]|uniref:ATP-grasp domain-containing protein n=1 Tax=Arenimonas metalli CF5-1 TaxID=1384056 RepID=A0A091B9D3_9GAMM|nr:hypothetical protein [Arenimonas metalli]KFN48107.1 hypothetical protein N787_06615 [Arenimonas metalli CF5-1]
MSAPVLPQDIAAICGPGCTAPLSAEALHGACFCLAVDPSALRAQLDKVLAAHGASAPLAETHPHLFAPLPVFVAAAQVQAMTALIESIERVVATEAYRETVRARSPAIANLDPGSPGGLLGFDFHLGPDGPRLIEINTNPGGVLINALLVEAQQLCLPTLTAPAVAEGDVAEAAVDVLLAEWDAQAPAGRRGLLAIVDEAPRQQYLYPEFVLFRDRLRARGIEALICDPADLDYRDGALWGGDADIGFVYNRCTDFMLDQPASAALRAAYLDREVALSPHPWSHALYADKRNLALLGDRRWLQAAGIAAADIDRLAEGIPRTEVMTDANRDDLWQRRKQLFFKPAGGFGSRASYRGDKLTHKTWQQMAGTHYVAQALVPPSQRHRGAGDAPLKIDLRAYAYQGHPLLFAARMYQGQTTNFRTPGGGFAPVLTLLDAERGPRPGLSRPFGGK